MPTFEPQNLYHEIEKSLKEQKFQPLYFFYGEEPYLIQQAVQYLKVCALHGGAADFNFTSYYASDVSISHVKDEVETLPMMTSRRVVLLKEVQDLSEKEWEELEPLFTSPVDSTVFILVGSKVDKRKKSFKILSEQAVLVEFKKPYENQIPGWIRHICKAHGLEINDDAVLLLHRLVGNHLLEIESEVLKLKDYLGTRSEVSLEDVAQCVSRRKEENIFQLAENIAKGDQVHALIQLAHLLEQGQSEIGIVALIARHIRILLQIKQGIDLGLNGAKLSNYVQIPHYYLSEYLNQSKSWTTRKLESALLILAETDKALKSSPLSSHIWLENLILKTCSLQSSNETKNPLNVTSQIP